MSDFNSMTMVAAAEMIAEMSTQAAFTSLVMSWGVDDFCGSGAVASRANNLVRYARSGGCFVPTVQGNCELTRAMVEHAITASDSEKHRKPESWARFVAGLKMDGFEIVEEEIPDPSGRSSIFDDVPRMISKSTLKRMLPEDIPDVDFREAEDEITGLLKKHSFVVAEGHLKQSMAAFQRGDWAASNSQLRTFYQELLDKIAENLGCEASKSDDAKRQFLADGVSGPFLIHEYNEWENDRGRPAFILGLWARLHPQGSHPGLSDEDDAAFRLQVTLITARLFLRRFDERKKSA